MRRCYPLRTGRMDRVSGKVDWRTHRFLVNPRYQGAFPRS